MNYIVTFFSHFGAIRFKKEWEKAGHPAILMPVPRNLSSSCGTCVRCSVPPLNTPSDEMEQIVKITAEGYQTLYRADNS